MSNEQQLDRLVERVANATPQPNNDKQRFTILLRVTGTRGQLEQLATEVHGAIWLSYTGV